MLETADKESVHEMVVEELGDGAGGAQPQPQDISPDKDGGVLKLIKREGTGEDRPVAGTKVSVHYTGTLLSGEKFDSSRDRGELFKFKLGKGEVIKAWDIGVATMKKGEVCMLTCAPQYAYGEKGSPPTIPEDATLIFEVELFDWQDELITTDGGVTKCILLSGEGYSKPNEDAEVSIHLRGTCEGNVFEERDVSFVLGEGSEHGIIDGVEKAIYKMLLREKARINIHSTYGFGTKGNSELGIPPNADLKYEIYLSSFEKAKEGYDLELDEKIEMSDKIKEKGTKLFKAGQYSKALHQYTRMIKVLDVMKDEEKGATNPKMCVAHLNAAMCNLKLGDYFKAREQCGKALKIENNNLKGLFRRGQAHLGLNELDSAKADFLEVLKIEPDNKAARNQLNIVKSKLKHLLDKDKRTYGNMFDRFALVDEKKENSKKKAAADKNEDILNAAEEEAVKAEDAIKKAEEENMKTTADQAAENGDEAPKVKDAIKKTEENMEVDADQVTANSKETTKAENAITKAEEENMGTSTDQATVNGDS